MNTSHLVSDLEVFIAVATMGSLAAAAPTLQRSPSTLSRQLARLEATYDTTLIRRTTRSASLTDDGSALLERAQRLLQELDRLGDGLATPAAVPAGRVRLSAPTTLGEAVVAPVVRELLRAHPDLEVHLDLSNRFVDLAGEGYDAVVRIAGSLGDSQLLARRLGPHPTHLYRRPGGPSLVDPADLRNQHVVVLGHGPNRRTWALTDGKRTVQIRPHARLASSSLGILLQAAVEGLGIASLPAYLARPWVETGHLQRVLPSWTLPTQSVWLLHGSARSVALDAIAAGVSERLEVS